MIITGVNNFKKWRNKARLLLQQQVPPAMVDWSDDQQLSLSFNESSMDLFQDSHSTVKVPSSFINIAKAVACYRDETRWSILYSVLWRLTHGSPDLLHINTDPEVKKLHHMQKAIHRDVHKMHAFVRFKKQLIDEQKWYVSWFEPSHLIVEYTADFFVKRFNTMNWSILTPDACAHWDQKQLIITQGGNKNDVLDGLAEDDMDEYWLQYYRSIFNPARLKTQAMQSEMPKKYWRNLPEAELIKELTHEAGQRTSQMMNNELSDANRLRNKSKKLRAQQDNIRHKNQ